MAANDGEALDVLLRRLRVGRLGEDQDLSLDRRLELIEAGGDRARITQHLDVLQWIGLLAPRDERRRQRAHGRGGPLLEAVELFAAGGHQQLQGERRLGGRIFHDAARPGRGQPLLDQAAEHVVDSLAGEAGNPGHLGGGEGVAAGQRDIGARLVTGQPEADQLGDSRP